MTHVGICLFMADEVLNWFVLAVAFALDPFLSLTTGYNPARREHVFGVLTI